MKQRRTHRSRFNAVLLGAAFLGLLTTGDGLVAADTTHWQPLCASGVQCARPYDRTLGGGAGGYSPINRFAAGPLPVPGGLILQMDNPLLWTVDPLTGEAEFPRTDEAGAPISNVNSVTFSDGFTLSLSLFGRGTRDEPRFPAELRDRNNQVVRSGPWHGKDALNLNNAAMIAPTVLADDTVYAGIRGGGASEVYRSTDRGLTWTSTVSAIRIGDDRFNLLPSPSGTALWAINSAFFEATDGLWASSDHGANWTRVDDGSFPMDTVRVIHHPNAVNRSFALSLEGLFISDDGGRSWSASGWERAVNGLVILDGLGDPAATAADGWNLVLGADDGVYLSGDGGQSWAPLSRGLPALPTTVATVNGFLVAVNDAGFFTCESARCSGEGAAVPAPAPGGIVILREYYNSLWGTYQLAERPEELPELSSDSSAEPSSGWVETGVAIPLWALAGSQTTTSMCEFDRLDAEGVQVRFQALVGNECRGLIAKQDRVAADAVTWRLAPYRYAAVPVAPITPGSTFRECPKHTQNVLRLFRRDGQLNHRYLLVDDYRERFEELRDDWILEGVAFCVPG